MENTREKVSWKAFFIQLLATISIAFLTSLTGFTYAWPSGVIENFRSNETVLSHPMSSLEISLLGSLTNVGGLAATPFCGYAVNKFGRKYTAMLYGLPFVLSWTIISLTNYVPLILAAMCVAGLGAAGQIVSGVYVSEIAQDSIRGALTSSVVTGFFLGLLFSYILGGYLTYNQVVYTFLTLSVLYIVLLTFLRESPVFLMQQGKEKEAAEAIAFYRRVPVTSKEVEIEITKIRIQLDPRINEVLQCENEPDLTNTLLKDKPPVPTPQKPESAWQFLRKSESSKRALMAVLIVMATTILMGSIVIQVYAEEMFRMAVPSMPPNICAIVLAVIFVCACFVCSAVVDKLGRKMLLTSTSAVSGIFTLLLGTQLECGWAPHWVTALLIYLYCFIYTIGAACVPFILTAEVFLPEVRGLGNTLTMGCMWIFNFITLMIFNPLVEVLSLGIVFCGFSATCFLGALYSHYCLPETKGLPADEIQLLFLKKKTKNNKV
ncbi:facilitated trehalose transporter Tret1-like [Leguminivora glycinivorella]|uniref:facilitated trehalose transporter Tret1-like n=1 Tax=Leguminivora glycinivorella TaxID=1035111 RepID=UPI00200E5775|nr:facilitated trehalose transporter Tret1-like [Leguminivora glycinivorella]